MNEKKAVHVVGAGFSGLSAAVTLAKKGIYCNLISSQPSERAQSVLAEGGINAALDTMGEHDTVGEHYADTMKGGCFLESENAVRRLTEDAPDIVRELVRIGVPFQTEDGHLLLRNFGGQKKKRTAYAKSSTGKIMMTALIDEVRKYESAGLVRRFPHHELIDIRRTDDGCIGRIGVLDSYRGETLAFTGTTILCTGGINGFFEGMTTGTTANTGNAAALAFREGAAFSNLEFIQYHPTTAEISGKRMLISEAARGEGGRLFILRGGRPWYFMEEKYPELGNLMPRDVVSREMTFVKGMEGCSGEVFLDMTGLSDTVWKEKLSDMRAEILSYMAVDPKEEPVPVSPGIHFFMGGIRVNDCHETTVRGLLAAGEAASKYHGANRLGGNSMLGALVGGRIAALTASEYASGALLPERAEIHLEPSVPSARRILREVLLPGLGILRNEDSIRKALSGTEEILKDPDLTEIDRDRARLGKAILLSALMRKESRGAHVRTDYPKTEEAYRKHTRVQYTGGEIRLSFVPADSL